MLVSEDICLFPILHLSDIVVSLMSLIFILSAVSVDSVEKFDLVMHDRSPILAGLPNICIDLLMIAPPGINPVQPFPMFCCHSPCVSLYFDVIFQSTFGDIWI